MACPSRRTLRRAGLHGLATQTWWTRVLGSGFCAAGSPWGGPPMGTSGAPPAQTELPCSLMPQLQAPASHTQSPPPPPCREANLRARRGTPCNHLVWDCDGLSPWDGPGPGWLCAQVVAWERPLGGWAGVPGEQSKGNLSSGGGAGVRGHSRSPRALCRSTRSGL